LIVFTAATRVHGCSKLSATVATHGSRRIGPSELMTEFNEEVHHRPSATPESLASQADERQQLKLALESLSPLTTSFWFAGCSSRLEQLRHFIKKMR
jgi:hypothetical protein